jgi:hypothetical protein
MLLENFNQLTMTLIICVIMSIYVVPGESDRNREIIKWKKDSSGCGFFLLLTVLCIAIPTLGLVKFPAITIFTWLILCFLFPLFRLKIIWGLKSRIFYNIIFLTIIFSSFIFLIRYQDLKRDFMTHIGVKYESETKYYTDSDGDESKEEYYYSFSGNKNLDDVINNYSIVFFSFLVLLFTSFILLIDRKLRMKILNQDKLELEKRNKEQEYLEE